MKKNITKPVLPLKKKRLVKIQKYCELNSEDEESSISSKETIEETKTTLVVTRKRSTSTIVKDDNKKIENRNLRSSRSIGSKLADQQNLIGKILTHEQIIKSNKDTPKDKIVGLKRKRESLTSEKDKIAKDKSNAIRNEDDSEEEESLNVLLDKLKKKKEMEKINVESVQQVVKKSNDSCKNIKSMTNNKTKEISVTINDNNNFGIEKTTASYKFSDDEESLFRGFTKKAISKITNTCNLQTNVKTNKLFSDVVDNKVSVLLTATKPTVGLNKDVKIDIKTNCIKPILQEHLGSVTTNSTAVNASVKLEPDLGDVKVKKKKITFTKSFEFYYVFFVFSTTNQN